MKIHILTDDEAKNLMIYSGLIILFTELVIIRIIKAWRKP